MFKKISKRIERIFDVVAPRASEKDNEDEAMSPQERRDESLARQLQDEEDRRHRMLKAQYDAEEQASKHGEFSFAKKQRVSYHHRGSDLYYDAVIIGVHLDDGPEKPYYTIKYAKKESHSDENGNKKDQVMNIEKQTTSDRLSRLPWDEEKTWMLLQK